MQELINRAEGLPPPEPTFDDELAEHLAAQEHPKPCPPRYEHGYVKFSTFSMPVMAQHAGRADRHDTKQHPGPITMEERGSWNWGAITGAVFLLAFWAGVTYPTWSRWVK